MGQGPRLQKRAGPRSSGFEARGAIPFPSAESIFSSHCGAISRLAAPLADEGVAPKAAAPSGRALIISKTRHPHVQDASGSPKREEKRFHFLPSLTPNRDILTGCAGFPVEHFFGRFPRILHSWVQSNLFDGAKQNACSDPECAEFDLHHGRQGTTKVGFPQENVHDLFERQALSAVPRR